MDSNKKLGICDEKLRISGSGFLAEVSCGRAAAVRLIVVYDLIPMFNHVHMISLLFDGHLYDLGDFKGLGCLSVDPDLDPHRRPDIGI